MVCHRVTLRLMGSLSRFAVRWCWILVLVVSLVGCAIAPTNTSPTPSVGTLDASPTQVEATPTSAPAAPSDAADTPTVVPTEVVSTTTTGSFDAFLEDAYTSYLKRDPEWVTELGLVETLGMDNSRLTDVSAEYEAQTYAWFAETLTALRDFDREVLTPEQQLSYDIFAWYLEDKLAGEPYRFHNHPVKQVLGIHEMLLEFMTDRHPVATMADAEGYVARLQQFPEKVDQLIAWLDLQAARGIVLPKFAVRNVIWQLGQFVDRAPERTELYTTFVEKLEATGEITPEDRERLTGAALDAITEDAQPAYDKLRTYFRGIVSTAPAEGGLARMPDGAAAYAYALHHHTTTDLTAAEIHELGLQEVTRIQAEMDVIFDDLNITGNSVADKIGEVAMRAGSVPAGEVLATYRTFIDEAEASLDPLFDVQPTSEVVIQALDVAGPAYYVSPSLDGARPGTFYVGVGGSGWRFAMPTLAYHEAVPGHHFQIALAQEMTSLPLFRRVEHQAAYAEGWALYAERLAWEAGWYADDPYGDVGRLQAELFRAARLVVDTGIHDQMWTREQAIAYMMDNVGHVEGQASLEVERYILWPGQATSYKIGLEEMLRLRQQVEEALGDDFDLKAFHRLILLNGAMPLEILERSVSDYIARASGE